MLVINEMLSKIYGYNGVKAASVIAVCDHYHYGNAVLNEASIVQPSEIELIVVYEQKMRIATETDPFTAVCILFPF